MDKRIMLTVHMQDEAALFLDGVKDRPLNEIFKSMEKRFGRITTESGLREAFSNMVQETNETVVQFAGRLRDVASDCYRDQGVQFIESEMIRQFFRGCSDKTAALQAAGQKFETVQDAVEFVVSVSERQASLGIGRKSSTRRLEKIEEDELTMLVRKVKQLSRTMDNLKDGKRKCFICDSDQHLAKDCVLKNKCFVCSEEGHTRVSCKYWKCVKYCDGKLHKKGELCPNLKCHKCGGNHKAIDCERKN